LLTNFVREAGYRPIVEALGQRRVLVAPLPLDLILLTLDVARVFRVDLDSSAYLRGDAIVDTGPIRRAGQLQNIVVAHLRTQKQTESGVVAARRLTEHTSGPPWGHVSWLDAYRIQPPKLLLGEPLLLFEEPPSLLVDESELPPLWCQPEIGVVFPQEEP